MLHSSRLGGGNDPSPGEGILVGGKPLLLSTQYPMATYSLSVLTPPVGAVPHVHAWLPDFQSNGAVAYTKVGEIWERMSTSDFIESRIK